MSEGSAHLTGLVWSVADLLRGDFKRSEYGKIILPFVVLRRLDCILDATKNDVMEIVAHDEGRGAGGDVSLLEASGRAFYNRSPITLQQIVYQPEYAEVLLQEYIAGFSKNVREVMERFEFDGITRRLNQARLLPMVVDKFVSMDLGPAVTNYQMGALFEDVIRRYAEYSNETAGEHFTPRDVVRLMVNLLISPDKTTDIAAETHLTLLDPVCGTGSLLSEAKQQITELNPDVRVALYGQEINPETWAICRADMMIKGDGSNDIGFGNALSADRYPNDRFDYLIASPPFGVDWKKVADVVRYQHSELGYAGRFGAGLPRINDGSLLFLQHMLAKMKPVDDSCLQGSRIVVVFNASPMHSGGAGAGESNIRKWIIENDLLEAVVALPDQLFYNTGIGTYIWVLTNNKSTEKKGRVVLLNVQDQWQKMRRSVGGKRKYVTPDQISEIAQMYSDVLKVASDAGHPHHEKVRIVRNEDLAYRSITIDRPLRLRYELSEESLVRLAGSRAVQKTSDPENLIVALRSLVGSVWSTKADAFSALRVAATTNGQIWPTGKPFERSLRKAIAVRDGDGEIQRQGGVLEPDLEVRYSVTLPLREDPAEYLKQEVHPHAPDAWIDHTKTKVGYEIPLALFFVAELESQFEPLRQVARLETARINPSRTEEGGNDRPAHLRAQDLHHADSAVELPDAPVSGPALTLCSGGDLVGRPGNWRLLPQGFGEAVTSMFVLHPLRGGGGVLCEWLNSRKDNEQFPNARDLMNLPVPADLVGDEEIENLIEDAQEGRRILRTATFGILPNVFTGRETKVHRLRNEVRSAAYEARLIGELVRPLEDPVWRAEWSYPYHVAALARRYRISTHPAERKDGLLKLGEGIARTLGILSLSEIIAKEGFIGSLRKQFRTGAKFGTWLWLIDKLVDDIGTPRVQGLASLRERDEQRSLLKGIKDFRNDSHHAHGVRAIHELNEDVDELEPRVVSAISSVNWLSGTHWDWVERCEYLDDCSYKLVGQRLRGSHPSWEPFERSSTYPLRPDRIYVDSAPFSAPVDLWPLAAVSLCPECRTRELFLLNEIRDGVLTLRSLEEHSIEIPHDGSE